MIPYIDARKIYGKKFNQRKFFLYSSQEKPTPIRFINGLHSALPETPPMVILKLVYTSSLSRFYGLEAWGHGYHLVSHFRQVAPFGHTKLNLLQL